MITQMFCITFEKKTSLIKIKDLSSEPNFLENVVIHYEMFSLNNFGLGLGFFCCPYNDFDKQKYISKLVLV